MNILKTIKHSSLSVIAVLGISLFSISPILATTIPNPHMPQQTKGQKLDVVDVQYSELSVQFRYLNHQLMGLRFWNISSQPLEIHIFDNNYVLGPGDYVVIDPPKVTAIAFSYEPYIPYKTAIADLLPARFTKEIIYLLPDNQNEYVHY